MTFSPLAWLKLQLFLHAGDTEVGGFAVSAADDLLYVTDFKTVTQYTTAVTVRFDDAAVADHFDQCVDAGLTPSRFARIWVHTHPGDSPEPSFTDENTFARVFGGCDWALMFICSRTGRTYARLRFFGGPGGEILLPTTVDWASWPTFVMEQVEQMTGLLCDWIAEYAAHVLPDMESGGAWMRLVGDDQIAGPRSADGETLHDLHKAQWSDHEAIRQFDEESRVVDDREKLSEQFGVASWEVMA